MAYLAVLPDCVTAAPTDLRSIGLALTVARASAAGPKTAVLAAGGAGGFVGALNLSTVPGGSSIVLSGGGTVSSSLNSPGGAGGPGGCGGVVYGAYGPDGKSGATG